MELITCPKNTDRGKKGDEMRPDFCRRCDEKACPRRGKW